MNFDPEPLVLRTLQVPLLLHLRTNLWDLLGRQNSNPKVLKQTWDFPRDYVDEVGSFLPNVGSVHKFVR